MIRRAYPPAGVRILGDCPDFVCRSCYTKYGWNHQVWCPDCDVSEPSCENCRYCQGSGQGCQHPRRKKMQRRNMAHEED